MRPTRNSGTRRDGWTPACQLAFLTDLAATRSVTSAARAAGMSRESAHRLRKREPNSLFAAAWDRALGPGPWPFTRAEVDESHRRTIAAACGPEGANLQLNLRHGQHRDSARALKPRLR